MHLCQGNCLAIGHAVMYYALAAHTFSLGIKGRHCTYLFVYVCDFLCKRAKSPYYILEMSVLLKQLLSCVENTKTHDEHTQFF